MCTLPRKALALPHSHHLLSNLTIKCFLLTRSAKSLKQTTALLLATPDKMHTRFTIAQAGLGFSKVSAVFQVRDTWQTWQPRATINSRPALSTRQSQATERVNLSLKLKKVQIHYLSHSVTFLSVQCYVSGGYQSWEHKGTSSLLLIQSAE